MSEPQDEQVIVATPDEYSLVLTVNLDGLASLHTWLPQPVLVKFFRQYADDIERGRTGGALGFIPAIDGNGDIVGIAPDEDPTR